MKEQTSEGHWKIGTQAEVGSRTLCKVWARSGYSRCTLLRFFSLTERTEAALSMHELATIDMLGLKPGSSKTASSFERKVDLKPGFKFKVC